LKKKERVQFVFPQRSVGIFSGQKDIEEDGNSTGFYSERTNLSPFTKDFRE
jgi:hypothetical protein